MEYITGFSLVGHHLVGSDWLNWGERLEGLSLLCNSFDEEHSAVCWQEVQDEGATPNLHFWDERRNPADSRGRSTAHDNSSRQFHLRASDW